MMRERSPARTDKAYQALIVCAVILASILVSPIPGLKKVNAQEQVQLNTSGGIVNASEFSTPVVPSEVTKFTEFSEPVSVSAEKQKALEMELNETFVYPTELQKVTAAAVPVPPAVNTSSIPFVAPPELNKLPVSNESNSTISKNSSLNSGNVSLAGTFKVYVNKAVSPTVYRSQVGEPSLGQKDNTVFYTGNWYAARSTDGGTTWKYVDPFSDMSDMCCDQDVIYDSQHGIYLWYRQGVQDSTGQNRMYLGVSKDALSWWFYSIKPTNLNTAWTGVWFDYPHLALGGKYLYMTTNVFKESFVRTVILRLDLADLSARAAPHSSYYSETSVFNFTPVQGAKDTMYFAVHVSNSQMKIYRWPDSGSLTFFNRNIPAWTYATSTTSTCPGPDGLNWCGRSDSRISGGYISNGVVEFHWNAGKGAGLAYPYINAATFQESGMTYLGRPSIWSPSFAWAYGFASPSADGDIGTVAFWGGGSYYPSIAAAILGGGSTPYHFYNLKSGTNGAEKWGDYLRDRHYSGSGTGAIWAGSGYTLQGCGSGSCIEPRYYVFGY